MAADAHEVADACGPPCAGWASGPLGVIQAADREIARQTAVRARAVAEFAASRPASTDRQPGQPGAMSVERRAARPQALADVSEWAAQELVVALSISTQAAEELLTRSLTLVHRLPRTLEALERGGLHPGHLWTMLERVAPIADDEKRGRVESDLLRWAAGRITTPGQLGAKARRMGLARDARDAAGRLLAALRDRGMSIRPDRREGMALLSALLTVPEAQALLDALGRYADALDDPANARTRGQKMADCLLDLVLRPGETDLPPVQAQITVVAGVRTLAGGDEPGEIGGEPVPAEMVRALARGLGLLPEQSWADRVPGEPPPTDPFPDDWATDLWSAELRAADQRWWTQVEARALREEWGGAESPPAEELTLMWAGQSRRQDLPPAKELFDPREAVESDVVTQEEPAPAQPPDTGWWATAHSAVDDAGMALLALDRAMGRARRAVADAQRADAADEAAWQNSASGRIEGAHTTLDALAGATADQRAALAALLDSSGGGTLVDRPRIAVVEELTGALLALTDSRDLQRVATCGGPTCRRNPAGCDHDLTGRPGLAPPGPTVSYRPGAALDRFVRARDRRCRFPGCRRRVPLGGELDHDRPWPEGPTSATNLTGYCTGHHRGKHQAPGWRHELAPDGTLTVTTPTGLTAVTDPPAF